MNYKLSIKQLLLRLLLLVFCYQICRGIFYLFNKNHFTNVDIIEFLGGIRFDLAAIFFSNILIVVLSTIPGNFKYKEKYQKVLKVLFFLTNALFIGTNVIDIKYYEFTNKRSTYALITASGMEGDILRLIPVFILNYWYLFLGYIFAMYGFWKSIPEVSFTNDKEKGFKGIFISSLGFSFFAGLVIIFGRGGFQRAPIKTVDAINYVCCPQNTAVVLNTPFTIFRTISKKDNLKRKNYFEQNQVNAVYQPFIELKSEGNFTKKNIVIIILESFGKENIYQQINGKKLTPFLDSLLAQGRYYTRAFANGLKSIDAVPSVITSIPCLMEVSYISSPYSFNKVDGFNTILKKEGYNTAFFHGAFNGSQNFNEFARIAKFDKYYGKNEYSGKDGYDGVWGIFDEEFLQFMAKELNTFKQPFFSTVFTISSHSPYTIPEKYKDKFPKGNREIHQSVAYSDFALKKFFETAKKQSWYNNSVFIITPDHTSREDKSDYYNTEIGNYSIPVLLFDPSNPKLNGTDDKLLGQIDILPEVLNYLNYKGTFFSFGNSPESNDRVVANYNEGIYRFLVNRFYVEFDGNKILNVYDQKQDSLLQNRLTNYPEEKLESKIKAYIQQYNNRLIDNKLSIY
ncbi:MAG: sulfatase-like hydrolase/transferase [Flavobacteriaceae bacterium]|nr:sulfatase-like hydrolase/transferase [Flavobacteriaceae bacterium]